MTEVERDGQKRLATETSPYLLQHADNPVHWWPWGEAALEEARRTGKPVLLSIGYAACHWCHVMAHESFEDDETARLMNELFVNIKVDREERPDIDAIYMGALQGLGEQGGWPLTMFLDGDGRPFWGGTYFPPTSMYGRPGFRDVLTHIAAVYRDEPDKVANNAETLIEALEDRGTTGAPFVISDGLLKDLTSRLARVIDPVHGGIQGTPKFPQWTLFRLLWSAGLRYGDETATNGVLTTLRRMSQGGIWDHIGGGFARYSVDEMWLVPHFEKMLYDNALLIDLLTEGYRETGDHLFRERVFEIVDWLEREMIADGGGFAASLDADSEGAEGRFYVWTPDEVDTVLGADDGAFFRAVYDITEEGNFEGRSIPNRLDHGDRFDDATEVRLGAMRHRLREARERRIPPGRDDKVLADWNGLMIASLARASAVFGQPGWLSLAERAFNFAVGNLAAGDPARGRLWHSWRAGQCRGPGTASDHANMIWAAIRLFEQTRDERYLEHAERWADVLDAHFWLPAAGGYSQSADDTGDVVVRLRSAHDDATPNANAVHVSNLAALHQATGEERYIERARAVLDAFAGDLVQSLGGHTGLLAASLDLMAPKTIVVTTGQGAQELITALHGVSLPGALEIAGVDGGAADSGVAVLAGKAPEGAAARAYLCLGPMCSPPLGDTTAVSAQARELRKAREPRTLN